MIYSNSFIQYLRDNLDDPVKVTNTSIICRCPWCEYKANKSHYHLFIASEYPFFTCYSANCGQRGFINKLITKIEGKDISDQFVDFSKVKQRTSKRIINIEERQSLEFPPLNENMFKYKMQYLTRRFKFSNISIPNIRGLILDVKEFVNLNKISVEKNILEYLQSNFVGISCEHSSMVSFRNVDPKEAFRYYKLMINDLPYIDYYKIPGNSLSNTIVMGEGFFDIFTEHIFDTLGYKNTANLYACCFGSGYSDLIKSIVFFENIYFQDLVILSDSNIKLKYYERLKRNNKHLINKMTVAYNTSGKDFNDTPITPTTFIV